MKKQVIAYGTNFTFDTDNNKLIQNFNWLIDVLQNETWEPATFDIFNKLKNEKKVAIDIGGWIGVTTIYLSKIFKRVITIEADNIAYSALSENIKDNFCDNVTLINKAFYNSKSDRITFGINSYNFDAKFGSSTSQTKSKSDNHTDYSIETISVFDIIKYVNPYDIGLVKVDIEGGDEDIFEELIVTAAKYNWKIWIAFHYEWWKNKDVSRFENLLPLIKKVSRDTIEIHKYDLLALIKMNVPESFLIEL